jgi:trans-aconitate 2-methyltransferase
MPDWNPELYLKFRNERTQPAVDLANRIPLDSPARVVDIGCGPGNSTIILKQRFSAAYILGVDNSNAMIETARRDFPELEFGYCDASTDLDKLDGNFDVVFSNACIQWLPDHPTLLRNMFRLLAPGGVLAVQTPMNYEEPIHKLITAVTGSSKWAQHFPNPRIFFNLTPSEYFDQLSELTGDFSLWMTTYYHRMDSHHDILTWYRSTGLKPYLDALPAELKPEFEQDILEEIRKGYPLQANGKVIFRFPRFFFLARASVSSE